MNKKTTYKTLNQNSIYTYEDKKSKFIAHAFKINNKNQIKEILKELKNKHPKSNHIPYAFRFGILNQEIGFSDDGEPTGSAGKPIYFEIKGNELQNVIIAVVRYFGGIKLGVGGLTKAFNTAAKNSIEQNNEIIEKKISYKFKLNFNYDKLKEIETMSIQNNLEIIEKTFDETCEFSILIPINKKEKIMEILNLNNIKYNNQGIE